MVMIGKAPEGFGLSNSALSLFSWAGGNVIWNESGRDVDLRLEGDTDANLLYLDAGNGRVGVGNAAPGAKLDVTGAVTLSGLLTVTGGQVAFPATQSASAGANTLDDYEEGTWTPTVASAGGGTPTYSAQAGSYVKVGQLVFCTFDVTLATKGTLGAGQAQIAGLPFARMASGDHNYPGLTVAYFSGMTTSVVALLALLDGTTPSFLIYMLTAAATAPSVCNVSDISATFRLVGSFAYRASA